MKHPTTSFASAAKESNGATWQETLQCEQFLTFSMSKTKYGDDVDVCTRLKVWFGRMQLLDNTLALSPHNADSDAEEYSNSHDMPEKLDDLKECVPERGHYKTEWSERDIN